MQRYDRQIRLWSESGQKSLQSARILAIGTSLAMAETLKNLVLAGIGELTLFDSSEDEIDPPVYPLYGDLGQLNTTTKIKYTNIPTVVDLVLVAYHAGNFEKWRSKFKCPIFIIGSNKMKACVALEMNNKPLFVLQPHPPAGLSDLRFDNIWPELQNLCDEYDLDSMNDTDHGHVPYGILLVKVLQLGTTDPKSCLLQLQRYPEEENFDQALKNLFRLKQPVIPKGVHDLIKTCHTTPTDQVLAEPFWLHILALEQFITKHNCLPVSGEVVDMFSSSAAYAKLKRVYQEKHMRDTDELKSYLLKPCDPLYTELFSKNCRYVQAIIPPSPSVRIWNHIDDSEFSECKEIPPVSALIGGIAAQESTKILINQYTPLVSLLKYDAVSQTTEVDAHSAKILN